MNSSNPDSIKPLKKILRVDDEDFDCSETHIRFRGYKRRQIEEVTENTSDILDHNNNNSSSLSSNNNHQLNNSDNNEINIDNIDIFEPPHLYDINNLTFEHAQDDKNKKSAIPPDNYEIARLSVDNMKELLHIENNNSNMDDSMMEVALTGMSENVHQDNTQFQNEENEETQHAEEVIKEKYSQLGNNVATLNDSEQPSQNHHSSELFESFFKNSQASLGTNVSRYVSTVSPLKIEIDLNQIHRRHHINFPDTIYFNYVKDMLNSVKQSLIHDYGFYDDIYRDFASANSTAEQISNSYVVFHKYLKLSKYGELVMKEFENDKVFTNCDGKKMMNDHRRTPLNISALTYIGICKKQSTIFFTKRATECNSYIINKKYEEFKKSIPNDTNVTPNLSVNSLDNVSSNLSSMLQSTVSNNASNISNSLSSTFQSTTSNNTSNILPNELDNNQYGLASNHVVLPANIETEKSKSKKICPSIYVMPYSGLILFIQQILMMKNSINVFTHASKNDINKILSDYGEAQRNNDVERQREILVSNQLGLHDLYQMNQIKNEEFDCCICLSIHSDGAGTNTTFNTFSATSTYIIQVELVNTKKKKQNSFNHIVYASYEMYHETVYELLYKEIKILESGLPLKANINGTLIPITIICYLDINKGDYKEVTDISCICSPSSKCPYVFDYGIFKSDAEIYYALFNLGNESKYYKQHMKVLRSPNSIELFKIYSVNGKSIGKILFKNIVCHLRAKTYLYRTYESLLDNIQNKYMTVKKSTGPQKICLLIQFYGQGIFHILVPDMFHSQFNICKRYFEILFGYGTGNKILKDEYDAFKSERDRELESKLTPKEKTELRKKRKKEKQTYNPDQDEDFNFHIQPIPKIMLKIKSQLSDIHSPFFGNKINEILFEEKTLTSMKICDILHAFAVILPLSFEALVYQDCYLIHAVSLFSTIIKLTFDNEIDINDPKYKYKERVNNFLYETFMLLPSSLYTDSMHILSYSMDLYQLHYKPNTLCAKNERLIKTYKSGIHQSSNRNTTAAHNYNGKQIADIGKYINEDEDMSIKVHFCKGICKEQKEEVLKQIKEKYLLTIGYENDSYRKLCNEKKVCIYTVLHFDKGTFIAYNNENERNDNCMIKFKSEEKKVLFGRLQYIIKINKKVFFMFDKIYVTQQREDSCLFNDAHAVVYAENTYYVPYLAKIEQIQLLPVAYTTHQLYYEKIDDNNYKRLSLFYPLSGPDSPKGPVTSFEITSFCIDSDSHFDYSEY